MPLEAGYSPQVIARNIRERVRANVPVHVAVASAYASARRAFRKAHPRKPLPEYLKPPKRSRS